ncbi:zinc finger protein 85 [Manduca sexta]|uniref:zinc finger protein 85 n=1 Tax=Manduca sexta TaxID=7130 RepID=UPI00188EFF6F|nr:zinc finger protein 85 [Manduca sexta]
MSEIKVCRICLSMNIKMYRCNEFELKYCYEQILLTKITTQDRLPKYFCYECAAMLYKFHKFKEKCLTGQKVLRDIIKNKDLTYENIKNIDRETQNLQSSLGIMVTNNKIKTCIIKDHHCILKHRKSMLDIEMANKDLNSDTDSFKNDYYSYESDNDTAKKEDKQIDIVDQKINTEIKSNEQDIQNDIKIDEKIFAEPKELNKIDEENIPLIKLYDFKESKVSKKNTQKDKKRKIRKKRKSVKHLNEESNPNKFKIQNKREKFLDSNNWEKFTLTEEEAEKEFKARSVDPKYLKMAYKCVLCFKGFSKEEMLNRHMKLRHNKSAGEISCRYCGMRFKWVCFLRRHMRQHYTKYKCLRCDLVCSRETTALFHEEYHNGVIRKCEHCGEEFKHSSTYYTHLRTHRSEFVCALCGASFVSAAGLHRHKLLKHFERDPEPVKESDQINTYCGRCDVKFETGKAYQEHLIHSARHTDGVEDLAGELPAPSNPKRRKKFFKRNYRKPTTCNKCGEHFPTQKDFIKHHLAAHPRVPIILPNERHICEICGISLAPVSVASHLNTHTRQKKFTCSVCGLQVYSKGSLTRHQLTHSDEKPYPCSLCEKRFKQKCSMQLHFRTFHLKEPYPKRNRRKKLHPEEIPLSEYRIGLESDDNITTDRWR